MEDSSEIKKDIALEGPKNKLKYIPEFIVAFGYILFFCLSFIFCFELIYAGRIQHTLPKAIPPQNTFAAGLPPTTPTPHIPGIIDLNASKIIDDDFTDNQNRWGSYYEWEKIEVRNGKLPLQPKGSNNILIGYCMACSYMYKPYYIEADFSTDKATDESFGLVVNLSTKEFYLFEINMESKKYFLYQWSNDIWSLRASGESNKIQAFPDTNTLGVYANKDFLELYINDALIDLYTETGHTFYVNSFGFYVNNSGFELSVDNLAIYKAGK
jgi:hypothetical protein